MSKTDLFHSSFEKQAVLLRGKILRVGSKVYTINEAEGFARDENERGIYKPIVDMAPGEVYCPRARNTILFLIACHDGRGPGGCVLIRGLLSPDRGLIDKPGNVSAALGITVPKTTGRVVELPSGELQLELNDEQDSDASTVKVTIPRVDAGLGKAVLKRHATKIAKAYARKGRGKFQDFLDNLVTRCRTEAELLTALKE